MVPLVPVINRVPTVLLVVSRFPLVHIEIPVIPRIPTCPMVATVPGIQIMLSDACNFFRSTTSLLFVIVLRLISRNQCGDRVRLY